MKPGKELDALVAKALGWRQLSHRLWHDENNRERWIDDREGAWSPSTDIAAAWPIAEMFKHSSFGVGWSRAWGVPYAMIGENVYVYAETVPLAICLAALEAVGVEVVEDKLPNHSERGAKNGIGTLVALVIVALALWALRQVGQGLE